MMPWLIVNSEAVDLFATTVAAEGDTGDKEKHAWTQFEQGAVRRAGERLVRLDVDAAAGEKGGCESAYLLACERSRERALVG